MIDKHKSINLIINGQSLAPACGLVCQVDRRHIKVIEEISLPNSGSLMDVAQIMIAKYGGLKYRATYETTPAKDGKANWSDSVLLYNRLEPEFHTLSDKSFYGENDNRILNSVNALNAVLSCNNNQYRLSISADAKGLMRDLEQCTYLPGTRKFNDEDKTLGHLSACLQILIYRLFPMAKVKKPVKSNIPAPNTGARVFYDLRHKKHTGPYRGFKYDLSNAINRPDDSNA